MARNGSGTYNLPPSNPVVSGTVIESDWANETMADLAAAITQSLAYDGQTVPIANLPMGGFRHTNVSEATSRNQYATLGTVQDGKHTRVQIVSGVDNLVGTLVGGATSYNAGSLVTFFAPAQNTGPMTLNYNGIGARSLVAANGLPLVAGNIKANDFLMAIYDGTQFKLMTAISSTVATQLFTVLTTGEERPAGGAYPSLTIATGTSVNIPAGTAWIVPPNATSPADATKVSWNAQTVTLTNLANSFTTTIGVNSSGQIIQFAGRVLGANLRTHAILGVVEHITGVANSIVTKPTIFSDDNYRITDMAALLTNSIVSGGLVVADTVSTLRMNISAGSIFMPGGAANTIAAPNFYAIPQQGAIPFRTMAGQNTMGGSVIQDAPIANYDPNGGGTVTVLPNPGDTTIHRLYFLYGLYIWVYGQKIYTSVENALSMIEWDRTVYKLSPFLMDATLVAEIVAQKQTTNLGNLATAAIVAPGAINFSIGSPGGISEAPIDGTAYGRQNAAWTRVVKDTAPTILTSLAVQGATPTFTQVQLPVGAGTVATRHNAGTFLWFGIETVNPDDKTYFRSYNPANSALRFTTTYDLATGGWNFPFDVSIVRDLVVGRGQSIGTSLTVGTTLSVGGAITQGGIGVALGPASSVDNDIARFSGVGGKQLKEGLKYQTAVDDLTANALLRQGAFGLGSGIALATSVDLNTVVNAGFYRIQGSPVNGPALATGLAFSPMLVTRGLDTINQTIWEYASNMSWTRSGNPTNVGGSGTWGPWHTTLALNTLQQSFDANTIIRTSTYLCANTVTNVAEPGTYGLLETFQLDSQNATQRYTVMAQTNCRVWARNYVAGWGPWKPLWYDSGPAAISPFLVNGFLDNGNFSYRVVDKTAYIQGRLGRNQALNPNIQLGTMPASVRPVNGQAGLTALWLYDNLASQVVSMSVELSGAMMINTVITVGGTPSGPCNCNFTLTYTCAV